MKKFIFKFVLFFAILSLIMAGAVLLVRNPLAKNAYMYGLRHKLDRLSTLEGERIVFVGGSSLAYGLDCEKIEAALGRKVVNTGIHAALGPRYMLSTVRKHIHKGDLVVLAFEYEHFRNLNGSEEIWEAICDAAPETVFELDLGHWWKLLEKFPAVAAHRLDNMKRYRRWRKRPPEWAKDGPKFVWNEHGDFLNGRDKKVSEKLVVVDGSKHYPKAENIEYILKFIRDMEKKGAKVVMMAPCFEERSFDNSIPYIERVEKALAENGIGYISEPARYRIPHELMLDTCYHLNGRGVEYRTARVIEDLEPILKN